MKRGPDVAISIPDRLSLTGFYLEHNIACGRGDKIAAYYGDEQYSFNDLCDLTNRMGNVLKAVGVGPGDRVFLVLRDSPEWLAAWFAAMKIGAVASHAYTYLPASDYEYYLNYVKPKAVIVDETTRNDLREAAGRCETSVPILVAGEAAATLGSNEHPLRAMLEGASAVLDAPPIHSSSTAFWNFSGGTTGKPKGVPHSHDHGVVGFESFFGCVQYTPDDIVLRVPKLFFHYARDLGMNWPLRAGAAVCLCPERSTAEQIFSLIEKHRPTILLNVPTMMRSMLKSDQASRADLSSVRLCLSSGELLSEQLYNDFTRTFGVKVINVHGSAEAYLGYFMHRPGDVRPGSSGKVSPLVEVKIVDTQGKEVAEGETGILWVRSDASGSAYHGDAENSGSTFLGNGWVNTNDLFREDKDGYFWFMGRANDLIKVSGIYVAPLEVEHCIEQYPAVRECAVLAVQDGDGLLKTKAFVTLKSGFEPSQKMAGELTEFCRANIAHYKAPRLIEFVTELPKTGQGKIDKQQLLRGDSAARSGRSDYAFASV